LYITKLNRVFKEKGCKIALLVDNASVHRINKTFDHIKIIFLPANTTSMLQPLDAGINCKFQSKIQVTVDL
jgi:hypothetical protein